MKTHRQLATPSPLGVFITVITLKYYNVCMTSKIFIFRDNLKVVTEGLVKGIRVRNLPQLF